MMKRTHKLKLLALLLSCFLLVGLLPTVAFAEGPVAWIGETGYETLEAAVKNAESGATITLGEGKYTLYKKEAATAGKDLTFVGQGDKTEWGIGATIPDPDKFGTEYNGDYSFDGAGTITFKNMTLQSGTADYLGFIRADKTVVENCVINGKTFYWGYTSATFTNTTFNCPSGDYALWTYSSPTMTFDRCTFNSSGKVINVYNEGGTPNVTINFKDCAVNSVNPDSKSVLNINDGLVNSFTINISGTNIIKGIKADGIAKTEGSHKEYDKNQVDVTCSKLFEFNTKYDNPSKNQYANSGKTVVSIDGKIVWQNGRMVNHINSDGHKDNAYTITNGEWVKQGNGTMTRTVKKVCQYCGYTEETTETKKETTTETTHRNDPQVISSPKTFDAGIALYAGMALLSLTGGAWVVNKKRSGK